MDFPSNLNHAIIPFDNPEISFVVHDVLYIDSYRINHHAYPFMEEASTQGERSNESLGFDLGVISCQPIAMILPEAQENPTSDPSVKAPIRVTRSVQCTRDEMLLARSTKNTHPVKRNHRRRMDREETREFYINATWSASSIMSTVCGVSFTLNTEILCSILEECGLAYGFCLGMVFEHFGVPVKELQIQTINDVLGVVDHDKEMEALRVDHSAEVDQLCFAHKLEREKLFAENCKVKEELAQTQVALQNERNINSGNLKSILELLSKGASSSSSLVPPSDSTPI
ncbi:hypothetical protein KY290_017010 [Solanum tuberosum]|uniref:Uncharacterized protein n=1 Tax=Solanum tuberosum TaxID=4113 RepID=A0ABQ7VA52_SOLTU|nr:hypothetical protein KY284_016080 [Solanum tuberosum]KAH0760937.1 hypothetical protein KY290_017010 [Solanum tuberosum]